MGNHPRSIPFEATQTAVILAAGCGTRLAEHAQGLPKVLLRVGNETLLERTVRLLRAYDVRKLVIATGYERGRVLEALEKFPLEIVECHNEGFARTQNAVSLSLCRAHLDGRSFFKLDGDVAFSAGLLERLDRCSTPISVAVDPNRALDAEAMKAELDEAGRILALGKQLVPNPRTFETLGVERIRADATLPLFQALELSQRTNPTAYYEDIYAELLSQGRVEALGVPVSDLPWTEIDTFQDLLAARTWVAAEAKEQTGVERGRSG